LQNPLIIQTVREMLNLIFWH